MTDPTPQSEPPSTPGAGRPTNPADMTIDLGSFLPEGSTLAATSEGSGGAAADGDPTDDARGDAVDLRILEQLETDLADVDAAIAAIDAGDYARSPLLRDPLTDTSASGGTEGG